MSRSNTLFNKKTKVFSPSVIRKLTSDRASLVNVTAASLSGTQNNLSSSFRYDPIGSPLKSTQQLPVDWSNFANHTFFNSAEGKINTSFDKIINGYPFDGTREELIEFMDSLTGYEKYIYDLFPKNKGYLNLGCVDNGEDLNAYISVKDSAGNYSPTISKNSSGKSVIDSRDQTISFEFFVNIPTGSTYVDGGNTITIPNGNRPIIQRLNSNNTQGLGIYCLSGTNEDPSETICMLVSSGTLFASATMSITKNTWTHVCAQFNKTPGINKIQLYKNGSLVDESDSIEINEFGYTDQNLLVGSGSTHYYTGYDGILTGTQLEIQNQFSGSIDELRVYHAVRNSSIIQKEMYENVQPKKSLKLYFKFNEPSGSYTSNNLILDYSGNSLHTTVLNYEEICRRKTHDVPVLYENENDCPVLFPSYQQLISLNEELLVSGVLYDINNPNLITKLIPRHYLQDATIFEGFSDTSDLELGDTGKLYGYTTDMPGGGKMGSPQIITSILFMWAKHFDEIKMFLDQFGKLMSIDPMAEDSIADNFLPFLAEYYGISLPQLTTDANLNQLIDAKNMKVEPGFADSSLRVIQNNLWRRILSDLNELIQSKGTIHSVKSLMLNMGINPSRNFRFKEFGGSKTRKITDARESVTTVDFMCDLSGSYAKINSTRNAQGDLNNKPLIRSPFLRMERTEPGYPEIDTTGLYADNQNKFITSGSWTYEAIYRFPSRKSSKLFHNAAQSLVRLNTTGSNSENLIYANLIANSGSIDNQVTGSLILYMRPQLGGELITLPLTGVDIFDGNKWYVSFGRYRNDDTSNIKHSSSSFYIRAGRNSNGKLVTYANNSIYFNDHVSGSYESVTPMINFMEEMSPEFNASGTFFTIGNQQLQAATGTSYGIGITSGSLNSYDVGTATILNTFFGGRVSKIKFWSKGLTHLETREHILNYNSLGVENPKVNFNFNTVTSGSYGRIRLDANINQDTTGSNSNGYIQLFDYSQNNLHLSMSGLEENKMVIKPESFEYSILSPHFEYAIANNKVRIRSFKEKKNVELYNAEYTPVYQISANEEPKDDTRFGVEVSLVQALNEDIMNIFATLDTIDNIIGSPESQFSLDYPDLDVLSDIYFNRLKSKINITKFFDFFRWFDSSMGGLIETLIPRKTKFMGVNFVIESHALERSKYNYNSYDMYIGPNDRYGLKGQILLQQFIAEIMRY